MKKTMLCCLVFFVSLSIYHDLTVAAVNRLPLRVQMVLIKISPLLEKQQYENAVEILSQFQDKANGQQDSIYNHTEINFVLGNCYSLLGRLREARDCYNRAVYRTPDHLGAWQNLAKTEYELENYTLASDAFFNSYQLTDKKEANFLYYSAITLLLAQRYQLCLEHFTVLLAEHPEAVTLPWKENLVYALLHTGKPKLALTYMIELARGFASNKQQRWREILLQQYMALDMRKEALTLVLTLTRQAPTVAVWWKGLAHIRLQDNDYAEALAAMTIYSFLSPMTLEEEKLLGDLYMQQGIPCKAVINYENYADKKLDKQTALSLVRAYRNLDRPELALQKLNTFVKKLENPELEMERGEILYSLKQYAIAASVFEKVAKTKNKHKARSFLMAGYSYWQLSDYENATRVFTKAAEYKKFAKEAQRALDQLANLAPQEPNSQFQAYHP